VGRRPPRLVHAYIELTPFDLIKYEVDKFTGYLRVDRPQRTSSQPPALYGFIPQTYCAERVSALSPNAARGDGDPLDICVLSERAFNRAEVILNAMVVGGLQVVDGGEADDKIVAVLENDYLFGEMTDISELPEILIERLSHYFATYKMVLGEESQLTVEGSYDHRHALQVVQAAIEDYEEAFCL
jgi:inorganic pyrophosphatase